VVIFSYTGSPQVKISQKVLGGLLFFDSHYKQFHGLQWVSSHGLTNSDGSHRSVTGQRL